MNVEIPANTIATIYLPSSQSSAIMENGKNIKGRTDFRVVGFEKDKTKIKIGSGSYNFTVKAK